MKLAPNRVRAPLCRTNAGIFERDLRPEGGWSGAVIQVEILTYEGGTSSSGFNKAVNTPLSRNESPHYRIPRSEGKP
jgi:hypothetical protein